MRWSSLDRSSLQPSLLKRWLTVIYDYHPREVVRHATFSLPPSKICWNSSWVITFGFSSATYYITTWSGRHGGVSHRVSHSRRDRLSSLSMSQLTKKSAAKKHLGVQRFLDSLTKTQTTTEPCLGKSISKLIYVLKRGFYQDRSDFLMYTFLKSLKRKT